MKTFNTIALILGTITASAVAQDLRTVNGKTVDLGPVHEWLTTVPRLKSERPMPHWKVLHLVEFKRQLVGGDVFTVRTEDGQVTELLIVHLEPAIRAPFVGFAQLKAAIAALKPQIHAEEDQLAGSGPSSSRYLNWRRQQVMNQLQADRRALSRLVESEKEAAREARQNDAFGFLAMSINRTYAGLPIWDCGQKK